MTLHAVLVLSTAEFLIASIAIVICGPVLGYVFSEDKEVIQYVNEMAPFLAVSIVMDSLQAVLSGVAKGSGWQHIGAYVNLGSYYVVCIPVALVMAFVLHLQGKGLWTGLAAGATVQSIALSIVAAFTNWDKQVYISPKLFISLLNHLFHSFLVFTLSGFFLYRQWKHGRGYFVVKTRATFASSESW